MLKSACVQAGFNGSPCSENAVTLAETDVTYTGLAFVLSKLPNSAVVPPG